MNFYEWFFLEKDRPAAGLFSWSHLLSVTIILAGFIVLAYFLGKKYKDNPKAQRLIIILTAASLLTFYIMKHSFYLATTEDVATTLIEMLPLFFCDMTIVVLPIAAVARGRLLDICYDFIAICGFIMGFAGNYLAGNIYGSHPAISYLSLISAFEHSLSAFAAMFVFTARLNKMEKRNIPFTIGMLFIYMTITLVVDYTLNKNFMFFMSGVGTPFDWFLNMVQGNLIAYQVIIYILQCGYMGLFYAIYYLVIKLINKKKQIKE